MEDKITFQWTIKEEEVKRILTEDLDFSEEDVDRLLLENSTDITDIIQLEISNCTEYWLEGLSAGIQHLLLEKEKENSNG